MRHFFYAHKTYVIIDNDKYIMNRSYSLIPVYRKFIIQLASILKNRISNYRGFLTVILMSYDNII